MVKLTNQRDPAEVAEGTTLGHVRLRNIETNEIILIPTPSDDPNDPLNWLVFFSLRDMHLLTSTIGHKVTRSMSLYWSAPPCFSVTFLLPAQQ
jgi:hypothetical protein